VGLTHDSKQRLASHRAKRNIGTKEFSDIQLIYHENYNTRHEAESREKQIKGWSVAKKKALILGDFSELVRLSRNHELVKNSEG